MSSFLKYAFVFCVSLVAFSSDLIAQETETCAFDCCRPDGHAPAAIMTDHVHGNKRWNINYLGNFSTMGGNMSGTKTLSTNDVLKTYALAPTQMKMEMHMLMGCYGISGKLTLMGMVQWMKNDMDMQLHPSLTGMSMPGMEMETFSSNMKMNSSGLGDSRLYLLGILAERNRFRIIGGLGVSAPTGSIENKSIPMWKAGNDVMTYCMQNGTGSWGLLPSLTFIQYTGRFSFGGVISAERWLADNPRNYRAANTATATAWGAFQLNRWISCSVRPEWKYTADIIGFDPTVAIAAFNDPTANTKNYGGQTARAAAGINFYVPEGRCRELRISGEYVLPVYQDLQGIQMKQTNMINLALQYSFM